MSTPGLKGGPHFPELMIRFLHESMHPPLHPEAVISEKRYCMSNNPEKKGVSAIDFFCIGFGATVGVGWQSPSTVG